jgi:hypothetical protein
MHVFATCRARLPMFYMKISKGAMSMQTSRALEDQFVDQCPVASYHIQLKTRTQLVGEPLQEFAIGIKQLTHHAFPALHKDHIHGEAVKAFIDSIREKSIKWRLLLGGGARNSE